MEMFVKKMMFLLVYVTLLFLVARMLEYIAWYETGLLMMKLVDPVSLSVKKLKSLLDGRGLNYEGVVDKTELTHLVESSGQVVEGDMLMMEQDNAETEEAETLTTKFSSKTQFYEEVEDKKDSIWLVQVIPRNHGPLIGKTAWTTVVKKLSRFGIRHGTFDCSIDPRICAQKNWNLPLLLLAMPEGHRHKGQVTMTTFTSAGKAQQIINWVYSQLAHKVHTVRGLNQEFDWDKLDSVQKVPVKIILFSINHEPPVFFSALNLKYSGRVKFIFVSSPNMIQIIDNKSQRFRLPSYILVTPEGKKIYGENIGEYCTYHALDIYLQTLTPEANDMFILSFINVNAICFIGLFVIQGGTAKRICRFLWTIGKYNITFLLLWLPLLGIVQLPFLASAQEYSYKILRMASGTWVMGKLRQDWLQYSGHSYIVLGSFLLYCLWVNWICEKIHAPTNEDSMTNAAWLRTSLADFYSFLLRPSPSYLIGIRRQGHREEGLNMFVEQMAVPNLWLHPIIPENYIPDLLTWEYSCEWQSSGNDSSDSEKGFSTLCRHQKKKCMELREYILKCSVDCSGNTCPDKINDEDDKNGDEDNLFVVKSQDQLHNSEFSKLSNTLESRHINEERSPNLGNKKRRNMDRQEARMQGASSLLAENFTNSPNEVSSQKCQSQENPNYRLPENDLDSDPSDTSTLTSKSIKSKERDLEDHSVSLRKQSPRHHIKDTKPKDNPRKKSKSPQTNTWPEGILFDAQCAICIEAYTHGAVLCGLHCGHAYHKECIVAWLKNGNHACPICRWPAYKKKGCKLSKHME